MSASSFRALFERPLVRVACAVLGVGMLAVVVYAAGPRAVLRGLGESIHALPEVAALELGILACSTLALRSLYGDAAAQVPVRQWLKAAALGFAVGAVFPIGRASAETSRALLLGRSVGGVRAAVGAVQMQGVALLANALLSTAAFTVALWTLGLGALSGLLLANSLLTGVLGTAILAVRQKGRPGRLLGLLTARGREFGLAFDAALGASRPSLLRSLFFETSARLIQVFECGVALAAIGHFAGPAKTLLTSGLLLVGGALGDVIPAQLGATEATLAMGATAVGLTPPSAATLALLVHGGQLTLAVLCGTVAFATVGATQPSTTKILENEP
jgi:hypothetical protein